jgi:alkylation response protein AidB-like acyl-CoA dehydrogenase
MTWELNQYQRALEKQARELAQETIAPTADETDRSEQCPWHNVRALTEAGFTGMTIPESYGGRGLGYLDVALVIEEMAKVCGVTARIVVEANMGAISAIMHYGSESSPRSWCCPATSRRSASPSRAPAAPHPKW